MGLSGGAAIGSAIQRNLNRDSRNVFPERNGTSRAKRVRDPEMDVSGLRTDDGAVQPPVARADSSRRLAGELRSSLFVNVDSQTRPVVRMHIDAFNLGRAREDLAHRRRKEALPQDSEVVRRKVEMHVDGEPDRRYDSVPCHAVRTFENWQNEAILRAMFKPPAAEM